MELAGTGEDQLREFLDARRLTGRGRDGSPGP